MPLLLLLLLLKNKLGAYSPEVAEVVLQTLAVLVESRLESLDVGLTFKCRKALHCGTTSRDGRKERTFVWSSDRDILIKSVRSEGQSG